MTGGILLRYDMARTRDPELWLALDEHERIELAERYHRMHQSGCRTSRRMPCSMPYENQIAEGLTSVARAMDPSQSKASRAMMLACGRLGAGSTLPRLDECKGRTGT